MAACTASACDSNPAGRTISSEGGASTGLFSASPDGEVTATTHHPVRASRTQIMASRCRPIACQSMFASSSLTGFSRSRPRLRLPHPADESRSPLHTLARQAIARRVTRIPALPAERRYGGPQSVIGTLKHRELRIGEQESFPFAEEVETCTWRVITVWNHYDLPRPDSIDQRSGKTSKPRTRKGTRQKAARSSEEKRGRAATLSGRAP